MVPMLIAGFFVVLFAGFMGMTVIQPCDPNKFRKFNTLLLTVVLVFFAGVVSGLHYAQTQATSNHSAEAE